MKSSFSYTTGSYFSRVKGWNLQLINDLFPGANEHDPTPCYHSTCAEGNAHHNNEDPFYVFFSLIQSWGGIEQVNVATSNEKVKLKSHSEQAGQYMRSCWIGVKFENLLSLETLKVKFLANLCELCTKSMVFWPLKWTTVEHIIKTLSECNRLPNCFAGDSVL